MLIQSPGSAKDNFKGFSKEELNTTNEKMEHVKRLLSTAATGTGIVGDLDAQQMASMQQQSRKGERNLWRLEEIKEMLSIMQETNALDLLNDKMVKSESVFHDIEKMMIRRGYNKKSHNQIWTKWKFLKSTYMTSRRNGIIPKMIPAEIYVILHKMLGNSSGLVYSVEDSSNAASFDGEQSMADEEMNHSSPSNLNGQGESATNIAEQANAETFGMAHPIFGFRLGMVKSEPADTGYETTANNSVISENDSLENRGVYPVELSPQESQDNSNSLRDVKSESIERVTDSPERPKRALQSERSPTPETDNSLLVPRETPSMSIRPLAVKQKITPTRALTTASAPLRIAPFAKETNLATVSPPLRTTEVANSDAGGSLFNVSPAITIPSASPRGSIMRLPKDVTLQLRSNYAQQINPLYPSKIAPNANPKPYGRRAEERFTNAAPAAQLDNQHQLQHEQPMTSQMAKLRANILNKKRRLEIPNWDTSNTQPSLAKVPRYSNSPANTMSSSHIRNNSYFANKPRHMAAAAYNEDGDEDDDDGNGTFHDYDNEHDSYVPAQPTYRPASFQKAYEQQYTATPLQKAKTAPPPPPPQISADQKAAKNRTPMEEILKDMAMSLRQSQLQMVNDFFEQQMELARKEHEFQMEQDRLLMAAFKKQTQQLMKVAQELFNPGGASSSVGDMLTSKNKPNAQRLNSYASNKSRNAENHKNTNTRQPATIDQMPNQQIELSSSDSEAEQEENGDSDPLLSAFDPTQFVSSELVDTNDENEDEDSLA